MSQNDVERFLGRLITDLDFRARAAHSLEDATCLEGIVLSKAEKLILNHMDFSQFIHVSDLIDDSIKRS